MRFLLSLFLAIFSITANAETLKINSDRLVTVEGEIDSHILGQAIQVLDLASKSTDDIYMIINSPGGSVIAGMQLVQAMQIAEHRGIHIRCVVSNVAASMAFVTFSACTERYAFPASLLLWHPMRVSAQKGMTEEEAREAAAYMHQLFRPLLLLQWRALNIPWKLFYKHYKLETLWSAETLNRVSPDFMTLIEDVEGVGNIFQPSGPVPGF